MEQSAWGMGAAGLIQEAWQDFCSLSHLFFLFSPFIQDKVLKFCKPRLEAMLNSVPKKMTWLAGPGAALRPGPEARTVCTKGRSLQKPPAQTPGALGRGRRWWQGEVT